MKTNTDTIRDFCQYYEAYVGTSPRLWRRPKLAKQYWDDMSVFAPNFEQCSYEEVPVVEIHMPEDKFRHLIEMRDMWNRTITRSVQTNSVSTQIWQQYEKESKLRNQYPALQDLWGQYQAMLKLVDDGQ